MLVESHAGPYRFLVVVWESYGQEGDVFGQGYDCQGVAQGDEFQINTYSTTVSDTLSFAATGHNQFIVAWESGAVAGGDQDGSGFGVFGQQFDFGADAITAVSPNTDVRWRVGSLQRIKWTRNLGLGATFRIELHRDDDGQYEELIAPSASADSATRGQFDWTVTGPSSATARVRVSWTDDLSVSDSSDTTFQIPPGRIEVGDATIHFTTSVNRAVKLGQDHRLEVAVGSPLGDGSAMKSRKTRRRRTR
jgi:hypothetical protein